MSYHSPYEKVYLRRWGNSSLTNKALKQAAIPCVYCSGIIKNEGRLVRTFTHTLAEYSHTHSLMLHLHTCAHTPFMYTHPRTHTHTQSTNPKVEVSHGVMSNLAS